MGGQPGSKKLTGEVLSLKIEHHLKGEGKKSSVPAILFAGMRKSQRGVSRMEKGVYTTQGKLWLDDFKGGGH